MLDERTPRTSRCIRCETCDGFSCLLYAKADSQVCAVDPALEYANVTLKTNALVERLETSSSGQTTATPTAWPTARVSSDGITWATSTRF